MKIRIFSLLCVLAITIFLFSACQKEIDNSESILPATGTAIWKTAGVTGQVVDANGMPIAKAEVKFGTKSILTDANGYFMFANATFNTGEAFVLVKKGGYFTGSRTFYPRQNSNNYIKIQLLNYNNSGNVDAATGGAVELRNGMKIELDANEVTTANGSAYTGQVNIAAAYLDPTAADINEKMPGDLRGVTTSGSQRILRSLGMVAVELTTPAGQPLLIKTGTTAKLTFPIPAALISNAPATVPLWYFNETSGLWKEEGMATRQGDEYIGEVSHFTFWNVDVPSEFVKLSAKITSPDGSAVAGAKVKITSLADGTSAYDFTDNTGYVDGSVPKGAQLTMEVYDNCNTVVLTKTIGPLNADTDLGNVLISSSVSLQTIYGTVKDCNGSALANGTIQVILNNNQSEFAVVQNGAFSITFLSCANITNAQLIAINDVAQQQGNPVTIQFATTNVNAGQLQACGIATNTFLNISINGGQPRVWNMANSELVVGFEDTSYHYQNGDHDLVIAAGDTSTNGGEVGVIYLQHPPGNILPPASLLIGDGFGVSSSSSEDTSYTPVSPSTQTASITKYGPIGQFIEGNFTGQFSRSIYIPATQQNSYDTVMAAVSFKVRRTAPF